VKWDFFEVALMVRQMVNDWVVMSENVLADWLAFLLEKKKVGYWVSLYAADLDLMSVVELA